MINTNINRAAAACITALVILTACSTSQRGLFTKKSPHEQYAARITDAGLAATALGNLWFAAADKALTRPLNITLPYQEQGYFAADKPDAAGWLFTARRGDQLQIQLTMNPTASFRLFADLWQPVAGNNKPTLLATADTTTWNIQYEVEKEGTLLLRLQPELLRSGDYTIKIHTAPSLAFPVPATAKPRIGSFWGDNRGGGTRSHEGIDIFGKFRTPVIAAASGIVTSTRENNLGGKVVFLRPQGKSFTLYYAHLDEQLVKEGDRVNLGDTLGLMGNTGNARNTPTHLHFGIYTNAGAIDPLPFVNKERKDPATVTAATTILQQPARNTTATTMFASPASNSTTVEKLKPNQLIFPIAATANWYKVILPNNKEGFIESKAITTQHYKTLKLTTAATLHDAPDPAAAIKTTIPAGATINILGTHASFQYITANNTSGWLKI